MAHSARIFSPAEPAFPPRAAAAAATASCDLSAFFPSPLAAAAGGAPEDASPRRGRDEHREMAARPMTQMSAQRNAARMTTTSESKASGLGGSAAGRAGYWPELVCRSRRADDAIGKGRGGCGRQWWLMEEKLVIWVASQLGVGAFDGVVVTWRPPR
nr:unnamed protein product [Digitaria exilis]